VRIGGITGLVIVEGCYFSGAPAISVGVHLIFYPFVIAGDHMISWTLLLLVIVLAASAPVVAAFLRAKKISYLKLYGFLVCLSVMITFVSLIMPSDQVVNSTYTWFVFGGYDFPTPWVLLVGFGIGNFIFLCLWALIKYADR